MLGDCSVIGVLHTMAICAKNWHARARKDMPVNVNEGNAFVHKGYCYLHNCKPSSVPMAKTPFNSWFSDFKSEIEKLAGGRLQRMFILERDSNLAVGFFYLVAGSLLLNQSNWPITWYFFFSRSPPKNNRYAAPEGMTLYQLEEKLISQLIEEKENFKKGLPTSPKVVAHDVLDRSSFFLYALMFLLVAVAMCVAAGLFLYAFYRFMEQLS